MIEVIRKKIGQTSYIHIARAKALLDEGKEPEMNAVLQTLYRKFLGEVPEKVTKENFEKLIEAIKNADKSDELVHKIASELGVSIESAAILSILYSNNSFVPLEVLKTQYDSTFSTRYPLHEEAFREKIEELKILGLAKEVLNGVALTKKAFEAIDSMFKAQKQIVDLAAELSEFDGSHDREVLIEGLKKFLLEFPSNSGDKKYVKLIASSIAGSNTRIPIDYPDIEAVMPMFSTDLRMNPDEFLPVLDDALTAVITELFDVDNAHKFRAGVRNLPRTIMPREAQRGENVSKLIQVEGIVTRVSEVKPFLSKAVFVCKDCGNEMIRLQKPYWPLEKPAKCDACGSRKLYIDHRASVYSDVQYIRVQDFPDRLKGGEMPRHLTVVLEGADLIDKVKAGDKVRITGVLHVDESKGMKKPLPPVTLVATWIENENKDYYDIEITPEDERKIIEFSKRPDVLEVLRDSLAPKIAGYKKEKLGLVLTLFGGVPKKYRGGRKRGDIHVLLFGDYATAKSQLMKAAIELAPRGLLVTSSHVTKAGLGAAAIRDEHTGEYVLEAGAFVIADNGTVGIDELDKMPKDIRDALHEILENQQISVNKAGINAVLNTRASCIATANPKLGKYNPKKQFVDQTNIPPTLLSRFDLIFIFTDEPDEERDREIAEIILDDSKYDVESEILDKEFMIKYIAYARQNIKPKMSKEAIKEIADYYVKIRKKAKETADPLDGFVKVPITARQLEAIRRLAEAAAKARLRNIVTPEDVKIAIDLMEYSLKKLIVDEEGEFDITMIEAGKSVNQIKKLDIILDVIRKVAEENPEEPGAPRDKVIELAQQYGFKKKEVEELIEKAKLMNEIYEPRRGYYKVLTF